MLRYDGHYWTNSLFLHDAGVISVFPYAKGRAFWDGSIQGNGRERYRIRGVMVLLEFVLYHVLFGSMKRSQPDLKRNMGIDMLKTAKFVITPAFKVGRADKFGIKSGRTRA